ncbi:MAG: hypothetical protein WC678_02055 [Parcubacteria group bacterium]|jgi:hypothetical protein
MMNNILRSQEIVNQYLRGNSKTEAKLRVSPNLSFWKLIDFLFWRRIKIAKYGRKKG